MQNYDGQGAAADGVGTIFGQNVERNQIDHPTDPGGTSESHFR